MPENPRTLVHFTDTLGFGGAERMLLTLVAGLDRAQWRQVLLHYEAPGVEPLVREARDLGMETRAVPPMRRRRGLLRLPAFVAELRRWDPAVFHAHLVWPLRCTYAILGARLAAVPGIVATQQLYEPPRAVGARVRQRLISLCVDRFIAVSNAMAEELRADTGRARRVVMVHNSIPTACFVPPGPGRLRDELLSDGTRWLALTLARLDAQKGLVYLLRAATDLPDVTFAIAGDGAERESLAMEAAALGVSARVRFLGYREDTTALLSSCDVVVLPSLSEGLPLSVLEAMAAGKAVVASDIPGVDEAVEHGRTGLLVPPRNPPALAEAIRTVLSDPQLACRLGEAGRLRARDSFTAPVMVDHINSLYDALLFRHAHRWQALMR